MTDLKLLALDTEDLDVISATTQDAVVRVGDMGFAKADQPLCPADEPLSPGKRRGKKGQRKRAALHFDRVNDVKVAGIDTNARRGRARTARHPLRRSRCDPAGIVELAFAGGGTVRLDVECLEARLQDLGAAWAAKAKPEHAA